MKQWVMIRSGMKKNRSASITLMVLIVISAIFLNIGLNVLLKVNHFVDSKNEEIHGAEFALMISENEKENAMNVISGMQGFEKADVVKMLQFEAADFFNQKRDKKAQVMEAFLLDLSEENEFSSKKIIDQGKEIKNNSIVLPYYLKVSSNYQTGDTVEIKLQDKIYEFEIYGFTEDILFATPVNISGYRCLVASELYQKILEESPAAAKQSYICVDVKDGQGSEEFEQEFATICSEQGHAQLLDGLSLNYDSMKVGVKATISIIMAILVTFAILIVCISLIIIRFSIASYIEEDIKNIGSMQAIGFTNKMLQHSLVLQFTLITSVGVLLGTVVSFLVNKALGNIIDSSMGLHWNENVTIGIVGITFTVLVVMVAATTYRITYRIRKITPLMALRNGIETFHFKKNHIPLDTTRGNIHWLLGLKGLRSNHKQNVVVTLIVSLMTFAVMVCIGLYYSLVVDDSNFMNMIGQETPQITIFDRGKDYQEYFERISKEEGIKKTLRYYMQNVTVRHGEESTSIVSRICNDYSNVERKVIAEGRNPEFDNEIALSYRVADELNVSIGDVVTVEVEESGQEYVVVGLMQHICYLGKTVALTEEGMHRCMPSYEPRSLYIYLENSKDEDVLEVIHRLEGEVVERGGAIANFQEGMKNTMQAFQKSIKMTCLCICVIATIITLLVLYYLVKMKIIKEKVRLGISKAVGFTTRQLILQIMLSFLPVILLGVMLGLGIAYIGISPMCVFILSALASVKNMTMIIPAWAAALTSIVIILLAMLITAGVGTRIRRIQARELVVE